MPTSVNRTGLLKIPRKEKIRGTAGHRETTSTHRDSNIGEIEQQVPWERVLTYSEFKNMQLRAARKYNMRINSGETRRGIKRERGGKKGAERGKFRKREWTRKLKKG